MPPSVEVEELARDVVVRAPRDAVGKVHVQPMGEEADNEARAVVDGPRPHVDGSGEVAEVLGAHAQEDEDVEEGADDDEQPGHEGVDGHGGLVQIRVHAVWGGRGGW